MCKRNCNNSSGFDLWWVVGFVDDSYRFLAIILTVYLQLRSEIIRDNGSIGSYYPFHGSGSRFSSTRDIEYPIYVIWSARIKRKFCFQPIAVPRGRLIFERRWKFPFPLFAEEKGQREHWEEKRGGTFLVLTFASFQRNEPRGKWKSKTKGSARDNRLLLLSSFFRSWKRYPFPLFTLAGEYPCSLSSWG